MLLLILLFSVRAAGFVSV